VVQSYFTFACTPLAGAAVFVTLIDTTARVLNERRQRTLNDLATGVALRRGDAGILERVREVLAHNPVDLPLAALYIDAGNGYADQRFCSSLHQGCAGLAKRIAWGGFDARGAHPLSALAGSFDAIEFDDAELLTLDDTCGVFAERPRRLLGLPFMAPGHGRPFGFLLAALNPRAPFDADYRHFIDTIAAVVATAVASVEAQRLAEQEELKMLYQRLQAVREAERSALAREVHDQLGQTLSAAKIDLKLLQQDARAAGDQGGQLASAHIVGELQAACDTLDRAVQQVRDIAHDLRAPELDLQGAYAAIEWHGRDFEKRTRIGVQVAITVGLPTPPRPMGEALLRIVQEALTNVMRHAHARQVWISIDMRGPALLLRIRDDGIGIAGDGAASLGITGMRERAFLAGGRLGVRGLRPHGTLVSALLPLAPYRPARRLRGWSAA
jgi:signal transduction histidine kinase